MGEEASMRRHSSIMNLQYQPPLQTQVSQADVGHSPIISVDDAQSTGDSIPFMNSANIGVNSVANSCTSSYIGNKYNEEKLAGGNIDFDDTIDGGAFSTKPKQRVMPTDRRSQFGSGNYGVTQRPKPLFRSSMTALPSEAKKMISENRIQRRDSVASKISRPKYRRTLTSGMLSATTHSEYAKNTLPPKPVSQTSDFRCKDNKAFGFYTGTISKDQQPHGRGKMVYDDGLIIQGIWSNGKLIVRDSQSLYKPNRIPGYSLGSMAQKRDIADVSSEATVVAVHKLRVGDCAFVCRSDGTWSYALVKSRSDADNDEAITFQVDTQGSIKICKILQFASHVRLPKEPDILPGYSIGDVGLEKDMIVVDPSSHYSAVKSISRLRINDGAFIQRSDHRWTYAIVKDRSDGDGDDDEASLTFQVDKIGSFKVAKRPLWGTYVRRVNSSNKNTSLTEEETKTFSSLVEKAKAHLYD